MHNEDQAYWDNGILEYNDTPAYGSEVSTPIAGSAKIFWEKPMKPKHLQRKLDDVKIVVIVLAPKKTNPEIWTTLSSFHRAGDCKVQGIIRFL